MIEVDLVQEGKVKMRAKKHPRSLAGMAKDTGKKSASDWMANAITRIELNGRQVDKRTVRLYYAYITSTSYIRLSCSM